MRLNVVLRYVGVVMLFIASFMLLSAGVSWWNNVDTAFYPLLLSSLLTALLGGFPLIFVERHEQISTKEGFCIVVGSWLLACFVSMFPYLIWGGEFTLINAWFESVSGYTTTGASILTNVEALPRGLQFWRFSTTWIGGMGVVMFALVVLPTIGRSKMTLSNVELSAMAKDNYHYRSQMIVQILLVVYVGLTAVSALALKAAGMNWFDAICHAMSACSTSGFSTKNASVAAFNSPMIDGILIITMCLAGMHFGLIYATVIGKRNNIFRSEVTRWYVGILIMCSLIITISLYVNDIYPTLTSSFRYATFQFFSLMTTTGFATADSSAWPPLCIIILMFGTIICACAGSTSGGLKTNRLVLAIKTIRMQIQRQQHPNAILRIKLDGNTQEDSVIYGVLIFVVTYILAIFLSTVINTLCGLDLITSFSATIACIGNVGPGFGEVYSFGNFAEIPVAVKASSTFFMLLGRLEIFGLIQLFFIKWWR